MIAVNEFVGDDAHHTTGPVGVREHDDGLIEQVGVFFELGFCRIGDLFGEQAALGV